MLARIFESFAATLDLEELVRRVVTIALEEFEADRAWLLGPANSESESANVTYEATRAGCEGAFSRGEPVPLEGSRGLLRRVLDSRRPVAVKRSDPDFDRELAERWSIRSQLIQTLRPVNSDSIIFGLHDCTAERDWSEEEVELFAEIGRYATIAIQNALLHRRALVEAAKLEAILDQIPEAAALYDTSGRLERINAAGRAARYLSAPTAEERLSAFGYRDAKGRPLTVGELPSMRALHGESTSMDLLVRGPEDSDIVVELQAAPVIDGSGRVVGAIVLSRDVTVERSHARRERQRRRRAEVLANLGFDLYAEGSESSLDDAAARIGSALDLRVQIWEYRPSDDTVVLKGSYLGDASGATQQLRADLANLILHRGEGLAGKVLDSPKPIAFDLETMLGSAAGPEREVVNRIGETRRIATTIRVSGQVEGVLTFSRTGEDLPFDADDLEFLETVAGRIGVANHVHRLNRTLEEGQRAAEELARREMEARGRLEAVLQSAPIGIAVVSAEGLLFESVNPLFIEFVERLGRTPHGRWLEGMPITDLVPGMETPLRQSIASGEVDVRIAARIEHEGRPWYFNRIIAPVRDPAGGPPQSVMVLLQNVTEQVVAREEVEGLARQMAERSAQLDSILGSMTDALWVLDARGGIVEVNPAALTMFGIGSREEAIGLGAFGRFHFRFPDGRAIPHDELPFVRALRGEVLPDFIAVARHLITGKDIDVSMAAAPIESEGVVGAVLVVRDITALLELDRRKDEFLSVASHELRTPLTTIKGYAQLLSEIESQLSAEERKNYFDAMLGEIQRMVGLLTDLLDVSRIGTNRFDLHRQRVEWVAFVESQARTARMRNPDRSIVVGREVKEVSLEVDTDRMRQVLDNFISNAIKYSADGTPIEIVIRQSDGHLATEIIDHGIGIPKDELPHLFERFHRARNVSSRYYGGLGLGLYISRIIVEAHGGTIGVESVEGEGSTFIIELPLAP